jgi:hypothetical protein
MKKIILIFCVILLLCGCVDGATKIGLDRLNWSQSLPDGEGITFSETGEEDVFMNWSSLTSTYITPEMFGAVGDNATDDSVALQAMIDYAEDNSVPILLPAKTYVHGPTLNIDTDGFTMRGVRGKYTTGHASRLRYTGTGRALNINDTSGGYTYKVTLEDFILEGSGTVIGGGNGIGIYCEKLSEFVFRDLDIRDFETGIYGNDLTIGEIHSCDISWNNEGIYIQNGARISIQDCNIWNNLVGIRQSYTTNIVMMNNQFERCTDFLRFDASHAATCVSTKIALLYNNFQSNPDIYSGSDGFAPYWDVHLINITDSDDSGNNLVISDMIVEGNYIYIKKTNDHIDSDLSSDSYAYIRLYDNIFDGANSSIVHGSGVGSTCIYWLNNGISGIPSRISGVVTIAGMSFDYDHMNVIGRFVLNTTASTIEGAMWYDASAKKMKFYNGTAVETINSS